MPLTTALRYPLATLLAGLLTMVPATTLAQEADPSPSAQPITGPAGSWLVTSFDAWEQGLSEPLPGSQLLVSLLDDGELEGETACGRFTGGWSAQGPELFLGIAPSGNLGCEQEQTAEAIGLATAFGAVTSWSEVDGELELADELGRTRVVLGPVAAADPSGAWAVVGFERPNGQFREPLEDGPMSVTLDADGLVGGSTGCRALQGQYALDGAGITLGPLEADGPSCQDAAARAERQLLRALGEVVYWRQVGDTLAFLDGFDEPLVELVRVVESEE